MEVTRATEKYTANDVDALLGDVKGESVEECLWNHEADAGLTLPAGAALIKELEAAGFIVNLETGKLFRDPDAMTEDASDALEKLLEGVQL